MIRYSRACGSYQDFLDRGFLLTRRLLHQWFLLLVKLKSSLQNFTVATMTWLTLWNICVINDHGYFPLVISTPRSFPHSRLITGCVTRLTRRVPLVEQELPTLPEHPSSPPVFSGVRVTRSLVLYECFVDRCLSFCTFSFGHCVVYSDCPFGIFKLFLYLLERTLNYSSIPSSLSDYVFVGCYNTFPVHNNTLFINNLTTQECITSGGKTSRRFAGIEV